MPDRLSHYVLLERLGTGGMGTVYRARDEVSGADVAVKVLHPYLAHDAEYVRRFEREARIAQSIDAPEVVKVLGSGREDETYFLVMELVPGETLAEVIQKRGRLPVDEAVGIATSVARAMAAAHARGIVHRDISPQNVMITPTGQAKVMDFGVSRDLTQATMTATSLLMGKPYYIAPELVTSASRPDIRSDIYALGVMLFQMLAGEVPFTAPTPYAVMQKHVTEAPPEVNTLRPDMPAWVVAVVSRCLAKRPDRRFQTPATLLKALEGGDETIGFWGLTAELQSRPAATTIRVGRVEPTVTVPNPAEATRNQTNRAPGMGLATSDAPEKNASRLPVGQLLVAGGLLVALLVGLAFVLSTNNRSGTTAIETPAPSLLKASWIVPTEGQLLQTGAFTFQAAIEPASLAATVSSLDLKVYWNNAWVTACYAMPQASGRFECDADVRAAEGPVSLSYDVIFKNGTVKYAAAGQRNVSRPVRESLPRPVPTAVPATPVPQPVDRSDCSAIRGTTYRSENERIWYQANCVATARSVTISAQCAPPIITPDPDDMTLCTLSSITVTIGTFRYSDPNRGRQTLTIPNVPPGTYSYSAVCSRATTNSRTKIITVPGGTEKSGSASSNSVVIIC